MSISAFFRELGAPLKNVRWSWGARRSKDGVVFLRVWQDRKRFEDGRTFYLLDGRDDENRADPGYRERQQHIESVRSGARCYLIMCTVKDPDARPRSIQDFNSSELFVGGDLAIKDWRGHEGVWIELLGRVPVQSVR